MTNFIRKKGGRRYPTRTPIKTSKTHPLRVDMLPLKVEGSIGMTFVPGKIWDGFTGRWRRDLDADIERLVEHYGTTHLVSLMEAFEYNQVGVPDLFLKLQEAGIDVVWHPIKDMTAPRDYRNVYYQLIEGIVTQALEGDDIVIHCKGGIGRTGMTASCCLVYLGLPHYKAIPLVRQTRPGTITRKEQIEFVKDYQRYLGH